MNTSHLESSNSVISRFIENSAKSFSERSFLKKEKKEVAEKCAKEQAAVEKLKATHEYQVAKGTDLIQIKMRGNGDCCKISKTFTRWIKNTSGKISETFYDDDDQVVFRDSDVEINRAWHNILIEHEMDKSLGD